MSSSNEASISSACGIGSINDLYDADPPYAPRGAISQAWSVGAVLALYRMIRDRKGA